MIPLDKFKRSLQKKAEFTLNEEEILKLREVQDIFAEAIFNMLILPKVADLENNQIEIKPEE